MTTWKNGTWIAFDVETSGIDASRHGIVELGWCVTHDRHSFEAHSELVNPGHPIDPGASAANGITDAMVADARGIRDVARPLLDAIACDCSALVAYNAPFDCGFMLAALGDDWLRARGGHPMIDPLVVVRLQTVGRYWRGTGRHKLGAVAERFEIKPTSDLHRAGTDAELALRVLDRLADKLPDDCARAQNFCVRERERQERQYQAWKATQPK